MPGPSPRVFSAPGDKAAVRISLFPSSTQHQQKFSGDDVGGAIPDPIPNSEVKPSRADGTARARAWESRSLPGLLPKPRSEYIASGLFSFRLLLPHRARARQLASEHALERERA